MSFPSPADNVSKDEAKVSIAALKSLLSKSQSGRFGDEIRSDSMILSTTDSIDDDISNIGEGDEVCSKLYGHISSIFPMLSRMTRRFTAMERKCLDLEIQNEKLVNAKELLENEVVHLTTKVEVLERDFENMGEQLKLEEELNKSLVELSFRTINWLDEKSEQMHGQLQNLRTKTSSGTLEGDVNDYSIQQISHITVDSLKTSQVSLDTCSEGNK